MINENLVLMFADGASRGNPGQASYGVLFKDHQNHVLFELSGQIGIQTNNVAEYKALLEGLSFAKKKNIQCLKIYMDSQLVVKQILGLYRVRNKDLRVYHQKILIMIPFFSSFSIEHIPRKKNAQADLLANLALDRL